MSDHFIVGRRGLPGTVFGIAILLAALLVAAPGSAQTEPAPAPAATPEAAPTPAAAPAPTETPAPAPPAATEATAPPAPVTAAPLSSAPVTSPSYAPIMRPRHPHSRGLIIAGAATWGGGYIFSVLVGALLYQADDDPTSTCLNCDEAWKMFVPLVGPFMFLPDADGADGKAVSAVMGGVQVIGFGLLVGGIIQAAVAHKRADEQTIGATLSRDGVPQLTLRF